MMPISLQPFILALIAMPQVPSVTDEPPQEEAAVRTADLGMAKAVGARDVEAFKSFIAPDGFFVGTGISRGPAQAASAWSAYFDPESGVTLDWSPTEATVAASKDLAYTIGEWTLRRKLPNGDVTPTTGNYLTVWRKNAKGRWLVAADGSLVSRDPMPPGFGLEALQFLTASFPALASPEAAVAHERQPLDFVSSAAGDMAFTFGEYAVRVDDVTGETHRATGNYFTVWTKEKGGPWKAVAENMTNPQVQ